MPMNAPRPQQGTPSKPASHAALSQDPGVRRMDASVAPSAPVDSPRKSTGYGLPCSKCRLYYPADLDICPTCHHNERVSPVVPRVPRQVAHPAVAPAPAPGSAAIEQEREEFLRQFKSQLLDAHAEAADAPESICLLGEHHPGEPATAEICKACYERLQEHLDVCEAALHLDLKEAAQIIYDAVWADPSDPSKTYQNAASALLSELRKRAGMNSLRGPFHPLQH